MDLQNVGRRTSNRFERRRSVHIRLHSAVLAFHHLPECSALVGRDQRDVSCHLIERAIHCLDFQTRSSRSVAPSDHRKLTQLPAIVVRLTPVIQQNEQPQRADGGHTQPAPNTQDCTSMIMKEQKRAIGSGLMGTFDCVHHTFCVVSGSTMLRSEQ